MELPLTHHELYKQIGIDPPRGVLLYGPPGTGKTMLAKAVANHTTAAFIRVVGSEFVQKYLGEVCLINIPHAFDSFVPLSFSWFQSLMWQFLSNSTGAEILWFTCPYNLTEDSTCIIYFYFCVCVWCVSIGSIQQSIGKSWTSSFHVEHTFLFFFPLNNFSCFCMLVSQDCFFGCSLVAYVHHLHLLLSVINLFVCTCL